MRKSILSRFGIFISFLLNAHVTSAVSALPSEVFEKIQESINTSPLIKDEAVLSIVDPKALAAFLNGGGTTENSQPNPIASSFPNDPTGTINATIAVLPIDYALARRIIPNKYGILTSSIKDVLPSFPCDKYPLVLSTQIDHDVQTAGFKIPDFTSASFRFPFVDLLGDGFSAFSYVPSFLVSNNPIAIAGAKLYDEDTRVATFNPPQDPYAFVPAELATAPGQYYFNVFENGDSVLNTTYAPKSGEAGLVGAYPLSFYTNITNQPTFGCESSKCLLTCDNMVRFFKTKISTGQFTPVGVEGSVFLADSNTSGINYFPKSMHWNNVFGVKVDTAFLENNYRNCADFKGYTYLGV